MNLLRLWVPKKFNFIPQLVCEILQAKLSCILIGFLTIIQNQTFPKPTYMALEKS